VQSEILTNIKLLFSALRGKAPLRDEDTATQDSFRKKYRYFQELIESNSELLKIVTDMEVKLRGEQVYGMSYIRAQTARAVFHALRMAGSYESLSGHENPHLREKVEEIQANITQELQSRKGAEGQALVLPYTEISRDMVDAVGGKSANLGEIRNKVGLPIPRGFAITTRTLQEFFNHAGLWAEIKRIKLGIVPDAPGPLDQASEEIQCVILTAPMPAALEQEVVVTRCDECMTGEHGIVVHGLLHGDGAQRVKSLRKCGSESLWHVLHNDNARAVSRHGHKEILEGLCATRGCPHGHNLLCSLENSGPPRFGHDDIRTQLGLN